MSRCSRAGSRCARSSSRPSASMRWKPHAAMPSIRRPLRLSLRQPRQRRPRRPRRHKLQLRLLWCPCPLRRRERHESLRILAARTTGSGAWATGDAATVVDPFDIRPKLAPPRSSRQRRAVVRSCRTQSGRSIADGSAPPPVRAWGCARSSARRSGCDSDRARTAGWPTTDCRAGVRNRWWRRAPTASCRASPAISFSPFQNASSRLTLVL